MRGLIAASALFILGTCGFFATEVWAAQYHVVEISGQAEGYDPQTALWQPLKAEDSLKVGAKIRTGAMSTAELSSDASFENVLQVGPNSRVSFLNADPARVSLDQGSLSVLKEDAEELRALTPDLLISVRQGGFQLEVRNNLPESPGTNVRVFADSVEVLPKVTGGYSGTPKVIEEGLQFSQIEGITRMGYPEYEEWQRWFKKNYERKDDASHDGPA